jgi:glycerol uptake facilitator-like aquaporin
MGERLAGGNVAIALLANALATGAALVALIVTFGPISGAHFNPLVTLATFSSGRDTIGTVAAFIAAQVAGAVAGVMLAHAMFGTPLSHGPRTTGAASASAQRAVATFGLIGVIVSGSRRTPAAVPFAVAAYIVAAYWFTASTSFANPGRDAGARVDRHLRGIRPADVPWFILGQTAGAGAAAAAFGWLLR